MLLVQKRRGEQEESERRAHLTTAVAPLNFSASFEQPFSGRRCCITEVIGFLESISLMRTEINLNCISSLSLAVLLSISPIISQETGFYYRMCLIVFGGERRGGVVIFSDILISF